MITMYAVANIDSALWGTRSIGEVKNALTSTNPDETNPAAGMDQAISLTSCRSDGNGGIRKRVLSCWRGDQRNAPVKSFVGPINEEATVPLLSDASDAVVGSGSGSVGVGVGMGDFRTDCDRGAEWTEKHSRARRNEEEEEEGRGGGNGEECCSLSLRSWKFVLLAVWVVFNMCVTATFLHWRLETVAELAFFSQLPSLMIFVVAAWVEMQFQRRAALPPRPADATDGGCACGARAGVRIGSYPWGLPCAVCGGVTGTVGEVV